MALLAEQLAPRAGNIAHRSADFLAELYEIRGQFRAAYQKVDRLFEHYASAGKWYDAPLAALWSLQLRIKNGETVQATRLASELLGTCLVRLTDPMACRVILEVLKVGITGNQLTLESIGRARQKLQNFKREHRR